MKRNIIVLDADKTSRRLLSDILTANDYKVTTASSGAQGYELIACVCPDIIILDLFLPDTSGIQLIRSIRVWSHAPIMVVTRANPEHIRIAALDAGADCYLEKPFSSAELLSYIRVCIRHIDTLEASKSAPAHKDFSSNGLHIDYNKRSVSVNGFEVCLTKNEYKILSLLSRYSGKVLPYDFIMKAVWGSHTGSNTGILRVNITNIRRKIEPDCEKPIYILTKNGVGYYLSEAD